MSKLVTASSAHASGPLALVIILAILALLIIGAVTIVRFIGRKGKEHL